MKPLPVRLIIISAVTGLIYGAGTSALNQLGPGAIAAVLGHGVAWAGLGLFVAWRTRTRGHTNAGCVGAVATTFAVAVVFYYLSDTLFSLPGKMRLERELVSGALPPLPLGSPGSGGLQAMVRGSLMDAGYWSVATVVLSVPVALVGGLMARQDFTGLMARLAGPVVLTVAVIWLQPDAVVFWTSLGAAGIWLTLIIRFNARAPGVQPSRD